MNYKCKGSTYITAEHASKLWKSKAPSKVRQQRYLNKTKGVHELTQFRSSNYSFTE